MSRAVIHESFGGPEVLEVRDVPEPHAGPGEVRVRVAAASLNPVDWMLSSSAELGGMFGYTVPSGFGTDLAGTVDEVGDGVSGFAVGDRVYGGARGKAIADHAIVALEGGMLEKTPDGVSDEVAATLPICGRTAAAVLNVLDVGAGDTVLIGGAAGGVGVYAVQLAKLAGVRVIGTASETTFDFLRELGAEPITYGPGLADRVRAVAPDGITAAADLFGRETIEAALELGVAAERICTIVPGPPPPEGVRMAGGWDAPDDAFDRLTEAIVAGNLVVPIAATFPIEEIRDAVALQQGRHVHGKVVVTL